MPPCFQQCVPGIYIYIETSGTAPAGNNAVISLPYAGVAKGPKCNLVFWYHMYGSTIGRLNVRMQTSGSSAQRTVWSKSGNQGNKWIRAVVYLGNSTTLTKLFRVCHIGHALLLFFSFFFFLRVFVRDNFHYTWCDSSYRPASSLDLCQNSSQLHRTPSMQVDLALAFDTAKCHKSLEPFKPFLLQYISSPSHLSPPNPPSPKITVTLKHVSPRLASDAKSCCLLTGRFPLKALREHHSQVTLR